MRIVWLAVILLAACGDPTLSTTTLGADSSKNSDTASLDGAGDAGNDGLQAPDTQAEDLGAPDAAVQDDAPQDVAAQDVAPLDTAPADAALADTGVPDTSLADTADVAADVQTDTTVDSSSDAGKPAVSTVTGGHCDAPFALPATQPWKHNIATPLVTIQGGPNHRIRDVILPLGSAGQLRGHFTYGTLDSDLGDETVELWVQTCPGWVKWGAAQTDSNGYVYFDVPSSLPAGDYRVKIVVLGDQTVADGMIAAWPAGMQVIVTDIDGTLTTSDWQAVQDIIFGASAEMYPDANTAIQQFGKKDYRMVYLTGRPELVTRYSRNWLMDHDFPLGTVHVTDDIAQTMPTEAGVQKFKADFLAGLQSTVKLQLIAGFGNATTDIGAYYAVNLPKDKVFIIGTNAGANGSTPVISYTALLPQLYSWPAASQP